MLDARLKERTGGVFFFYGRKKDRYVSGRALSKLFAAMAGLTDVFWGHSPNDDRLKMRTPFLCELLVECFLILQASVYQMIVWMEVARLSHATQKSGFKSPAFLWVNPITTYKFRLLPTLLT